MSDFEPTVIGFLCNWCSYSAADSAGGRKMEYPAGFRVIRTMCSGRVEPQFILRAFQEGADGVAIFGCHPGECHYKEGNHNALRRFAALKKLLGEWNVEPERVRLEWISAAESEKFVAVVKEFYESVRALGPRRQAVGV